MRASTLLLVAATVASVVSVDVWWESAVVYQIYPRSFKDSNGDGVGDLQGITSKLSYLAETGVDAIWMSPIFKSPMYDAGYDIEDYTAIADEFGTMADFDALLLEAKKLGIRVVLDFVPNHTSNTSNWFNQSIAQNGDYTDYFVWANGKVDPDDPSKLLPPSNWVSQFRKSAWEYNNVRKQYYLHQFVIGQPDLNYRSAKVREEMKNVLRFWLDKGVSGFRVDAVNYMYEVDPANHGGMYPDEPLSGTAGATADDYNYLTHIYTRDQNETYDVIYDWRAVLDEYTQKTNESKIMMTEAYAEMASMMRYYGTETRNGSIPFNFIYLGEMTSSSTAKDIKLIVDKWMTYMPTGKVANWVNGNHDQSRMATRYGVNRVDTMNMMALILPGVTITYQGEELGMTDGAVSWAETQDPQACNTDDPLNYWKSSRDPARTPYHWDATANAGFSTASKTWLPVASNYLTVNLAAQQAINKTHYHFYKDVVALKHTPAVRSGDLGTHAISEDVFVITRSLANNYVVGVINLSSQILSVDLSKISGVPDNLTVAASGVACTLEKGKQVAKNAIPMPGNCALALQSVSTNDAHRFLVSFTMYCILFFIFGYLQ